MFAHSGTADKQLVCVHAAVAMSYNEYYQLMQMGFTFTDNNVYRFCDHVYWYD